MTTTTDRDDLYRQAIELYERITGRRALGAAGAIVDLVLDAQSAERPDWEVLREAAKVIGRVEMQTEYIRARIEWLTETADVLESEHQAAQEKAAAEVGRGVPQGSRDYLVGVLTTAARVALNDVSKQLAPFLPDGAVAELAGVDVSEAVEATADAILSDQAAREKLIEQAARVIAASDSCSMPPARRLARALADAGLLAATETTDGGAA